MLNTDIKIATGGETGLSSGGAGKRGGDGRAFAAELKGQLESGRAGPGGPHRDAAERPGEAKQQAAHGPAADGGLKDPRSAPATPAKGNGEGKASAEAADDGTVPAEGGKELPPGATDAAAVAENPAPARSVPAETALSVAGSSSADAAGKPAQATADGAVDAEAETGVQDIMKSSTKTAEGTAAPAQSAQPAGKSGGTDEAGASATRAAAVADTAPATPGKEASASPSTAAQSGPAAGAQAVEPAPPATDTPRGAGQTPAGQPQGQAPAQQQGQGPVQSAEAGSTEAGKPADGDTPVQPGKAQQTAGEPTPTRGTVAPADADPAAKSAVSEKSAAAAEPESARAGAATRGAEASAASTGQTGSRTAAAEPLAAAARPGTEAASGNASGGQDGQSEAGDEGARRDLGRQVHEVLSGRANAALTDKPEAGERAAPRAGAEVAAAASKAAEGGEGEFELPKNPRGEAQRSVENAPRSDTPAPSRSHASAETLLRSLNDAFLRSTAAQGPSSAAPTPPAPPAGTVAPLANGAMPGFQLAHTFGQPGWDKAMGERVVWMARQGLQEAQIQLNPRNMGPVEVRISVSGEQQASVHFVAQNPATRDALEAAMPRLREMFSDSGLNLSQSDVSQQQAQQRQGHGAGDGGAAGRHFGGGHGDGEEGLAEDDAPLLHGSMGVSRGVDYYA